MTNATQSMTQSSPEQVADLFIRAVIRNDSNAIGRLLGVTSTDGKPMNQVFGPRLGEALSRQAAEHGLSTDDYRWSLKALERTDQHARLQVDLYAPDTVARAKKMEALLGYTTGTDGTLQVPKTPPVSYKEAEQQAKTDPSIQPVHYRVPLQLIKQTHGWIVDSQAEANDALISVIRQGETSTDNDSYRQP